VFTSLDGRVEVLEGSTGLPVAGWPYISSSSIHAAPIPYDFDHDGTTEIIVLSDDGTMTVLSRHGVPLGLYALPPLRVPKVRAL